MLSYANATGSRVGKIEAFDQFGGRLPFLPGGAQFSGPPDYPLHQFILPGRRFRSGKLRIGSDVQLREPPEDRLHRPLFITEKDAPAHPDKLPAEPFQYGLALQVFPQLIRFEVPFAIALHGQSPSVANHGQINPMAADFESW